MVLNENIQVWNWAEKTAKEPCISLYWTFLFLSLTVLIIGSVPFTMKSTWVNMNKNRCECISNTKTLDDIKIISPNTLNLMREFWWERFQIYLWTYYKMYFYNSLSTNLLKQNQIWFGCRFQWKESRASSLSMVTLTIPLKI